MTQQLELEVLPQPDDATCGPTCLHAVYRYYGDHIPLTRVISEVTPLPGGGTLAVWLGCHALRRGYRARIYSYDLQLFDPTWFEVRVDITARLRAQLDVKSEPKVRTATEAFLEFCALGGQLDFEPSASTVIRRSLRKGVPVLTGLSATFLYNCAREYQGDYDDVRGLPMGHFVVVSGYDREVRKFRVADPLHDNPRFSSRYYWVGLDRLVTSIMLGTVTYDANLLVVTPTTG